MPFTNMVPPKVGDSTKLSFANTVIENLADINARIGATGSLSGGAIPNGSFELDADEDNIPDAWLCEFYPGGTGGIDSASASHGTRSCYGVHPGGITGNGGMSAVTDGFFICSSRTPVAVNFQLRSSVATTLNQVFLLWHKADKTTASVAQTNLYSAGSGNPTAWTRHVRAATPPSDAAFFKVGFVAAGVGGAAGTTWFDDFSLWPSGVPLPPIVASTVQTMAPKPQEAAGAGQWQVAALTYTLSGWPQLYWPTLPPGGTWAYLLLNIPIQDPEQGHYGYYGSPAFHTSSPSAIAGVAAGGSLIYEGFAPSPGGIGGPNPPATRVLALLWRVA